VFLAGAAAAAHGSSRAGFLAGSSSRGSLIGDRVREDVLLVGETAVVEAGRGVLGARRERVADWLGSIPVFGAIWRAAERLTATAGAATLMNTDPGAGSTTNSRSAELLLCAIADRPDRASWAGGVHAGFRSCAARSRGANAVVIVWRRRDRLLRQTLVAGGDLCGVQCAKARLVALNLRHGRFTGANFERADLTEADLRYADLRGANLRCAFLTGAQLDGADLTGADLRDTYLIATNFGGAVLGDSNFDGAVWDQATTWPPGFSPPFQEVGMWHGARRSRRPTQRTDL
jgi:hypothetical protein